MSQTEPPMLDPFHVRCEIGTRCKRPVVQNFVREHAPLAIVLDRNQNVCPIFGLEHAVRCNRAMCEPHAPGRHAAFVLEERHGHPIRHCVEHRDGNGSALAGAFACDERLENPFIGVHAGSDIAYRDADTRGSLRGAGDRCKA